MPRGNEMLATPDPPDDVQILELDEEDEENVSLCTGFNNVIHRYFTRNEIKQFLHIRLVTQSYTVQWIALIGCVLEQRSCRSCGLSAGLPAGSPSSHAREWRRVKRRREGVW